MFEMKVIKENIASIKHNDPAVDNRVELSIAYCSISCAYAILADGMENASLFFENINDAERAIDALWGRSPKWDLRYN